MRVSELIEALEEILDEHGDIEATVSLTGEHDHQLIARDSIVPVADVKLLRGSSYEEMRVVVLMDYGALDRTVAKAVEAQRFQCFQREAKPLN
jgi:hypothetical protein